MDFERDILECLDVLKKGGLILYPTDTIWGIGCDATNELAVEKIYKLKQRAESKSMIVLVAEEKDVLKYVASPDLAVFGYLKKTEKATTVIYKGPLGLAENLSGEDRTIAIRICNEIFCRQLLKRFRKPIVSTSANYSGESTPRFFNEIGEGIKSGVDYIVQYRQDDKNVAEPSTVIKWNNNGSFEVIRK